jgi:hypothetical protein
MQAVAVELQVTHNQGHTFLEMVDLVAVELVQEEELMEQMVSVEELAEELVLHYLLIIPLAVLEL